MQKKANIIVHYLAYNGLIGFIFILVSLNPVTLYSDITNNKVSTDSIYAEAEKYIVINPEKAIVLLENIIKSDSENIDNHSLANYSYSLGIAYRNLGENQNALEYFINSLESFRELDNSEGIAKCLNDIGRIFRYHGSYDRSLDYHLRSLSIYDSLYDERGIASTLINAGVVYRNMGYEDKALENYERALDICQRLEDTTLTVNALISIGNVYWYMQDNKKALYFYQEAYSMAGDENNPGQSTAGILNNIGNVYRQMVDVRKALNYYRRSLAVSTRISDKNMIAVTNKNLGIIYKIAYDYEQSAWYLEKSKELAEKINLTRIQLEVLSELSEVYAKMNKFSLAFANYKSYTQIKDSIYNEETRNKITTLRLDYELNEKNRENEILQKNLELSRVKSLKDRNFINSLVVISILIVILAIVLYVRFNEKHKTNKKLMNLNLGLEKRVEERTRRLQEENEQRKNAQLQAEIANEAKSRFLATINHEVRTPINAIIGFCDLTIKTGLGREQTDNLRKVMDSSRHLLSLFKDIVDYSQIEKGTLELSESSFDLSELLNSVLNAFYLDARGKSIKLNLNIE
ncbi:MAG: tetratricopeptide repeat protein, partial [Bacteroidales bacterium]|nr:tetratricopeptide repeat protein [Bacteroidales bacterium]